MTARSKQCDLEECLDGPLTIEARLGSPLIEHHQQ